MALLVFSQLIGRPVLDKNGEKVATLRDLVVRINPTLGKSEEAYPPLAGILARTGRRDFWIPVSQIQQLEQNKLQLGSARLSLERFSRRDGEILLAKDVLDKQLVDVEGRRLIRVNDLGLAATSDEYKARLVAVDISFEALWRRIAPVPLPSLIKMSRNESLLNWADVEYFASSAPTVRLSVSHQKLAHLHPAEIGRLLDDLPYVQAAEILESFDDAVAANVLEEMQPEYAADVLEHLDAERAADMLEEMEPDDAADVIAGMVESKAQTILELMEQDEQDDVRELLSYPPDTAGGMMTNSFLMLPKTLEAAQALRDIRALQIQPEFVDYIYIVEPETDQLVGVVALRDVVFCQIRETPLSDLIESELVTVFADTPAEDAAAILADYGFRAMPVVNREKKIVGIITFDDALDLLLPENLRRRIPKIFRYHRSSH